MKKTTDESLRAAQLWAEELIAEAERRTRETKAAAAPAPRAQGVCDYRPDGPIDLLATGCFRKLPVRYDE